MQLHRGIAASPLLRMVAEPPPLGGFVEQRCSTAGGSGLFLDTSEELDDASTAAEKAVAAMIQDITEADVALVNCFTEMLDVSVFGINRSIICGSPASDRC